MFAGNYCVAEINEISPKQPVAGIVEFQMTPEDNICTSFWTRELVGEFVQ